jgi:hypothetical protein
MSHPIMSDLLLDLSTEEQEFLAGGQTQPPPPPATPPDAQTTEPVQNFAAPPVAQGAYGYIVPDGAPYYYWWRLNGANLGS